MILYYIILYHNILYYIIIYYIILYYTILYYIILYYMHVHKRPRRGGTWDHRRYATLGVAPCAGFGCQGLRNCCSCSFSSSGQVPNCAKFTKLAAASAPAPGGHGPNLARFTNLVSIKCWFLRRFRNCWLARFAKP